MYKLGDKILENCGNKAKYLSLLKSKGYNIPFGIVIDFEEFKNMISNQKLNFETIDKVEIPDELIDKVFEILPKGKKYAIRSSASIEDSRNISLAGKYITYLNVVLDRECFKDKIKTCFLSLYSTDNLQFYRKNNIDINKIEMNIIIQEMIESNVSGILFTVNPTSGKDTEIVVEFSKGFGEIVDGKIVPERLVYDWMSEKYIEEPKVNIMGDNAIKQIVNISLNLQQELGFPIDVEFGIYDSKLYIFQIRPITKINQRDINYRYTDINFNNYSTLSKFMSSIEEKVCNSTITSFVNTLKILNENEVYKPITINRFSRIYWNLTLIKKILENVPGYIERNFDEYIGTRIDYIDNGKIYANNTKNKFNFIAKKSIIDVIKKQIINVDEFRKNKIEELEEYKKNIDNCTNIYEEVVKLINVYYDIKSAFVWQGLINAMYKVNLNKKLEGILNPSEVPNLFLAIDDKYESGPTLYIWDTTRKIRENKEKLKFFEDNLDAEIFYLYRKDRNNEDIKEFLTDFIDSYGYYSLSGKDIINKTYDEEILKVIKLYRDLLELDERYDPLRNLKEQNKIYEQTIKKVEENTKKQYIKNILKDIEFVRSLISKSNSLKDLSLRAQSVLRKYILVLGKQYKEKFIIENEEDMFHLDYKYILNPIDISKEDEIRLLINKNKIYYNSFRNYNAASDIFPCSRQIIEIDYKKRIKGIGASFGKVNAKACIVNSKEDLKNLRKFDVLVTKYKHK